MTTLNVIETKKEATATVTEMAMLNFAGEPELQRMSDKEIADISRKRCDDLYNLSYIALGQMRMDKEKFVLAIRQSFKNGDGEIWFSHLDNLAYGQDLARHLLSFFETAEARLLVAMATVEQEKPNGPDGGEEIPQAVAS